MITLQLTPDWDLTLDSLGNIATTSGGNQIAQDVSSSCRIFKGEAVFDNTRGLPYLEDIIGKGYNEPLLNSDISVEAKRISGVAKTKVTLNSFTDRNLDFNIEITTTEGETVNV